MTNFIDAYWSTRVAPPSMPFTHPSLVAMPAPITVTSAVTSTSTSPSPSLSSSRSSSSRSSSPSSESDNDDDYDLCKYSKRSVPTSDNDDDNDLWKFGKKSIPHPDPPAARGTITNFVEIRSAPLVPDPEDPTKWTLQKYKAPLDKFASSYVPLWLRTLPAPGQFFMLPAAQPFPSTSYADQIIPSGLDNPRDVLDADSPSILASSPLTTALAPLQAPEDRFSGKVGPHYQAHWSALLAQHLEGQVQAMAGAKIHEIAIDLDTVNGDTLKIMVPGIREDSPKLNIGDRMMLRPLDTLSQTPAPFIIEVEVVGLDKLKGGIYVRSEHLAYLHSTVPMDLKGNRKYQIEFKASTDNVCDLQDAVRFTGLFFETADDILTRWIWPQKEDHIPSFVPYLDFFYDQDLNQGQRQAVSDIVAPGHAIPYLISGPPGTGKTKTMVESALQILRNDPTAKILLSAPSNAAADTLVRRLKAHLLPQQMFRLNSDKRTFAEVPQTILPYCFIENDKFGLPPIKDLMKFRIVVTTCSDTAILTKARVTNYHIQIAREHFEEHLYFLPERRTASLFWTHLLIDEAAQASEPETLAAIEVVLPAFPDVRPTLVLCGDRHQLGPVIASRLARKGGLDISLLERLFSTGAYPDVKTPRDYNLTGSCSYLVENYRSMPAILMAPSGLFYDDSLVPAAKDVQLIKWSGLSNPSVPILFKGCETEDMTTDEGASWYNEGEINQVVDTILSLQIDRPDIQAKEIAVITPWREQVWRIRARLRSIGLHGVDVGHVESYQGAEFKVTILSCVRSRRRYIAGDRHAGAGFYDSPKRFNVAITRAKELLVIIGNANLLKGDVHWRGLLHTMQRHNLYVGPELQLDPVDKPSSDIEYYVKYRASHGKAWEGTNFMM